MVPDQIARLVRGLHPSLKAKVKKSLGMILDNPAIGKALKEELRGLRSFRVSKFRIVYRVAEAERQVQAVAVGPRASIYQETYRLLVKDR